MRVLLDTTYARRGRSGTGVYLDRLVPALRAAGIEVVEAANERRPAPAGGGAGSARNLALDAWWTQVQLPRRARAARADVLHHPLPALAARAPCAQVVTLHDLAFERLPELFSPAFRRYASLTHRRAARGAGVVVCVSQTTRRDAMARWGLDPRRIVVAPHGPGQQPAVEGESPPAGRLRPAERPPAEGLQPAGRLRPGEDLDDGERLDPGDDGERDHRAEHFLYVGDDEPRKNLALLLDAHARYRRAAGPAALPLVLAGRARADQEGVRCEPEPDLGALLAAAAALVHPALHEGFGLTALEAMSAGVPVLAARSPGLAETCGDAARYVDPYDAAGLADELRRIATEPALRADLSDRGRAWAASFSWQASARAHIAAYTLALDR
jgi:glycosyltransferase involved in cell wall biosynthesis